jgi:hypothetical protein
MGEERDLFAMLPGTWRVAGTNFPMWLDGSRHHPRFEYRAGDRSPDVLDDVVTYMDREGQDKTIVGRDRRRGDHLVWRGAGLLALVSSRWRVTGASDDGDVLALRFDRTLFTPAGVDVIVRDGAGALDARRALATDLGRYGLTTEEFASLSWLAGPSAG